MKDKNHTPRTTEETLLFYKKAVLWEPREDIPSGKTITPEFYRLYQQSVLLALKEQDVLNEIQVQLCLDTLSHPN